MLDLSRVDWEERIVAGKSLVPDAAHGINPDEAARALAIFDKLRLADVPGMPALKEAAGEWFREIVSVFLGSVDAPSGARLIRELFALVPKKNSKTSYGAGMMLTALLLNKRPRAEFLLIGPTQAVSDLAFDQIQGMIENDPDGFLQKRMHVQEHLKTIVDRRTKAELKIKTFDSKVLTGVKPVGVLVDELHEISRNSRASKIIGQLRGGLLGNPEGFLAFITTQSDEQPAGAFKAELATARAIRDGKSSGRMMPVLYEFPAAIMKDKGTKDLPPAWQRPENWHMVLPNLNRPMTIERLIEDFHTAQSKGEQELKRWASQHLNIQIGVSLGDDSWAGAEFWEENGDPTITLDWILENCDDVVSGTDGGGLDDLLGLCVLGRIRKTGILYAWFKAWAHPEVLKRRKEIAERLLDYIAQGDLILVAQIGEDVRDVVDIYERLEVSGKLPGLDKPDPEAVHGVDQAGINDIIAAAMLRRIPNERFGGVPQGYRLNGAIKSTERNLAAGTLKHSAMPMMEWQAGNAKIEQHGNAITITKQTSGLAKIDCLAALFDAIQMMARHPIEDDEIPADYEVRFWA